MTQTETLKLALEALERGETELRWQAITAIKEALAQPEQEFIKHHGDDEGWSEWVCPDPDGYLMKCCDCGLVHEAEFGVVRYKSETEREDCDRVDDPNLQAVFRMRRSEQWSPEDTAHRAGGLPMAQPEQEPVAYRYKYPDGFWRFSNGERVNGSDPIESQALYTAPQPQQAEKQEPVPWQGCDLDGMVEAFDRVIEAHFFRKNPFHNPIDADAQMALRILRGFIPYMKQYTTPQPQREWVGLTDDERAVIVEAHTTDDHGYDIWCDGDGVARAIEAKLKEKNT